MALLPGRYLLARLAEDPTADRDDETGLLRERDELLRQQKASLGVLPPMSASRAIDSPPSKLTMGW